MIGKNIDRYSRIPKKVWSLKYFNYLGDRLILASIANSNGGGIDENAYEFILENFVVKNFKIFDRMHKKVKYFDFLNGKFLDELHLHLFREIKFKNVDKNFKLTINELIFDISSFFLKSCQFFSNLYVKKHLSISRAVYEGKLKLEVEKLLLKLIRNTSNDIESIKIPFESPTREFIEKFVEILNERKKLQTLYVNFDEKLPKSMKVFFLDTSVMTTYPSVIEYPTSFLNNEQFNESLKYFDSIENLYFHIVDVENINEIEETFIFLKTLNLNNLKRIHTTFCNSEKYGKEFYNFLNNCPNLKKLELSSLHRDDNTIFDIILPSVRCLEHFQCNWISFNNPKKLESFKTLLSRSSFQEISFFYNSYNQGYSMEVITSLQNLQNTLTSLTIVECGLSDETFRYLSKMLQKFRKLEHFHFDPRKEVMEYLPEIFRSLQSSSQTLQTVIVKRPKIHRVYEDSHDLFSFLEKCRKLTVICIGVLISVDKIPELLLILGKFKNILEEINLDFCWSKKYRKELFHFLSGCSRLRNVQRHILGNIKDDEKGLMESLENSRYYIHNAPTYHFQHIKIFPNFFISAL